MIPWWQPSMTGEEQEAVAAVLASGYLNEGKVVAQFERAVADLYGMAHGVATTSGTMALYLAYKALGVGPGTEVVVPALTMIATANAARMAGADVVLGDVESAGLTLEPESCQIGTSHLPLSPRTRAVAPVHVSGRLADIGGLLSQLTRAASPAHVIEDAAETVPQVLPGPRGEALCLSFSPHKIITTGQGGMVLTNFDALAQELRALKNQGRGTVQPANEVERFPAWGFNGRMTDVQAAIGLAQLTDLPRRLERLARNRELYAERLPVLPTRANEATLWVDCRVKDRDGTMAALAGAGFGSRPFWCPLAEQEPYKAARGTCLTAMVQHKNVLWLPSTFAMADADVIRARDVVEGASR